MVVPKKTLAIHGKVYFTEEAVGVWIEWTRANMQSVADIEVKMVKEKDRINIFK